MNCANAVHGCDREHTGQDEYGHETDACTVCRHYRDGRPWLYAEYLRSGCREGGHDGKVYDLVCDWCKKPFKCSSPRHLTCCKDCKTQRQSANEREQENRSEKASTNKDRMRAWMGQNSRFKE